MIPNSTKNLFLKTTSSVSSSLTYKIYDGKILGMIDEKEALKQAVELILKTQRCGFGIYSLNYGTELQSILNISPQLLKARAKSKITDALLADKRIKSIENFQAKAVDKNIYISFEINSIFGAVEYEGVI